MGDPQAGAAVVVLVAILIVLGIVSLVFWLLSDSSSVPTRDEQGWREDEEED